jgi:superfamily II DNA or RNA helicase
MEIIQNKALLVETDYPERITSIIPKSKLIEHNKVLVHWGQDECKVLHNLGFKETPSLIERDYQWTGMYQPFKHQKISSGFLSLNKRAYILSDMGCVDSDTEYLSPTGWVKISAYAGGEVAQYYPDTKAIEFVTPKEYVKLPCNEMIYIKTKYGVDQMLSPEHRMIIHDGKAPHKWVVNNAEQLYAKHEDYQNRVFRKRSISDVSFNGAAIPAVYSQQWGKGLSISNAALRVQVALIADGYFPKDNRTNWCIMRLKRPHKVTRMHEILLAAGIEYRVTQSDTPTAQGFHVFRFNAPIKVKEFDSQFWSCSQEQIDIIYDEVLRWDGSIDTGDTERFARFSSNSKASADFVQAVFNSKGHVARITQDPRVDKYKHGEHYSVSIRPAKSGLLYLRSASSDGSPKRVMEKVPSTDGFKYCFMVDSTYLVFRRNGCVFASGNTGKTNSVAWAADYLMKQNQIKRMLVICPMSIMKAAWQNDLFKSVMHRSVGIAHGSRETRKKVIQSDVEIVIINYDGVEVVLDELIKGGFDLIVLDEATAIKRAGTKRWKQINQLVQPDSWLWLMTGTPAAQSPLDAYGLVKLMHPHRVDKSEYQFKDRVMYKASQFVWRPKVTANDHIHALMQPAIRFTKEECLDLPELMYTTREVEMTAQQKMYYKKLKDQMTMDVGDESITAMNAAIAVNKLLQIASGSAYTDTKEVIEFDSSSRYKELVTCIEESSHSVLVFCTFRHSIIRLQEKLSADGYEVDVIHGEIALNKRSEVFDRFQTSGKKQVLIIQPQSAAHGVTLHAANTIVWWSPTTSYETYAQANARVHRAGQVNKCSVIHLQGSGVEKKLYAALQLRSEHQMDLLGLYKNELYEK